MEVNGVVKVSVQDIALLINNGRGFLDMLNVGICSDEKDPEREWEKKQGSLAKKYTKWKGFFKKNPNQTKQNKTLKTEDWLMGLKYALGNIKQKRSIDENHQIVNHIS